MKPSRATRRRRAFFVSDVVGFAVADSGNPGKQGDPSVKPYATLYKTFLDARRSEEDDDSRSKLGSAAAPATDHPGPGRPIFQKRAGFFEGSRINYPPFA
jgi:hypothetical protein